MEDNFMKDKWLVQSTFDAKGYISDICKANEVELDLILYDELTLGKSLYKIDCTGRITRLDPNTDFIIREEAKRPLSTEEARARLKHLIEINSVEEE